MPTPHRSFDAAGAADHVRRHAFEPPAGGRDHSRVGVEIEWLTAYREAGRRLPLETAQALVADLPELPRGSHLSIEPGGQLELSSASHATPAAAIDATAVDLLAVDRACAERRVHLIALGADPLRPPCRVVTAPRYRAMQRYFDARGSAGRTMMCNTAAVQLNVGLGPADDRRRRWRLAHAIGPALVASFANSPLSGGGPTGWQSSRLRAWWALDPSRSAPPAHPEAADPADAWLEYALDAQVMLIRVGDDEHRPILDDLPFGRWLTEGHELGWPTEDDFAYHLTTLFPPVRPKGWLELRSFDALPTPLWMVAVAVTCALLDEAGAEDDLRAAVRGTEHLWVDAAQLGLGHPDLARAAAALFDLAAAVLASPGHDDAVGEVVGAFNDRWTARRRSPADEVLDAWRRDGSLVPSSGHVWPVPTLQTAEASE